MQSLLNTKAMALDNMFPQFLEILFQALNIILLTSPELFGLRVLLKESPANDSGKDLFLTLYATWCYSPPATISLCLLSQVKTTSSGYVGCNCMYSVCRIDLRVQDLLFFCGHLFFYRLVIAILWLVIFSQAYQHTTCLILALAEEDLNLKFFVHLDKLIRLLETPTFVHLRLQVNSFSTFICNC